MLLINLAILKLFIDDRNSFTFEERKNFGLTQNAIQNVDEKNEEEFAGHITT